VAIISNGTTIADAGAFSASLGSMVLIKTLTASSSGTLSFVHGSASVVLDSTYPVYLFKFINMHPSADDAMFTVGFRDGGSNYDATKTTTAFECFAKETAGGGSTSLGYSTGSDLAQSTDFQNINAANGIGNGNDECLNGELTLFNPSNTTFVKHFIATSQYQHFENYSSNDRVSGYCNVTAAIDAVQFKMHSGNIDSGIIKLYGIKDS
jgi:hypothetical protein